MNADNLTHEQALMLAGFDKALDEISEGLYDDAASSIAQLYGAAKASPLHTMILGYAAGMNLGMRLAICAADAEKNKQGMPPCAENR